MPHDSTPSRSLLGTLSILSAITSTISAETQHILDPASGLMYHASSGSTPSLERATLRTIRPIISNGRKENPPFGEAGHAAFSIGAGFATESESNDYQGNIAFHYFIGENFEFNVTASGWYFAQDEGDDAFGANIAGGFRLYFTDDDKPKDRQIAPYLELGIGVIATGEEVPPGGTHINFTPRAGAGALMGREGGWPVAPPGTGGRPGTPAVVLR
ncbi:MAG: hypothetical protein AAGB34_02340, partial [Planctomycetota bacterium]